MPALLKKRFHAVLLLSLLTSSLSTAIADTAAAGATVNMTFDTASGFAFSPQQLTVPAGTTVTFNNGDGSNHSVVFKDGTSSGRMKHHSSWTRTFGTPGRYEFHCGYHDDGGTIVVE